MLAWHFVRTNMGLPVLRDGRRVVVGEWVDHYGTVKPCKSGLHASLRAIDALGYLFWDNAVACLVQCDGVVKHEDTKLACSRRRVISMTPCDDILRAFARRCALDVAHLWDMPEIVREYLETGRGDIRDAARNAARAAAGDAARAAAWAAARYAAWAAAGDAAGDAARAAAGDAAREKQNATLESMLLKAMGR